MDTWLHPSHYAANEKVVERELGKGFVEYGLMGAAAGGGFAYGRYYLAEPDGKAVRRVLESGLDRIGSGIPELKVRGLNESPYIAAAKNQNAVRIHADNQNKVVQVDFGDRAGTGFIVDGERGWIATNWHVGAARGALPPTLITPEGYASAVEFKAGDLQADLAILQATRPPRQPWPEVEIGNSGDLSQGSELVIIGHPVRLDETVLSTGKFKGLTFKPHIPVSDNPPPIARVKVNAPILGGSSGSPIFDEAGKVVAVASSSQGNSRTYGTASEHLKALIMALRSHEPLPEGSWLDVSTRLTDHQRGLPGHLNVTSTANIRPPFTPKELPEAYENTQTSKSLGTTYNASLSAGSNFAGMMEFIFRATPHKAQQPADI